MLPFPKNDIDVITRETLRELIRQSVDTALSIYVPTSADTKQGPIYLKNLLTQAQTILTQEHGMRLPDAEDLLAPVRAFVGEDERDFWQTRIGGVAFFLAEDFVRVYRLAINVPEMLIVNKRFHVKPLLPLLNVEGLFYTLCLDLGGVRLWKGGAYVWEEIPLLNTPLTLEEAMRFYDFSQEIQSHTNSSAQGAGGRQSAVFHGSGSAGDRKHQDMLDFFRQVNDGVMKVIASESVPLVLIGNTHEQGAYREANHYPHLLPNGVNTNPADLSPQEMHQQVWELVKPLYNQEEHQFLEDYRRLAGNNDPLAIDNLATVVEAAYYHQVVALFVRQEDAVWGQFDYETGIVTQHATREEGDEDLIDFAISHTLLNGGRIYPDALDVFSPLAAILRFVM